MANTKEKILLISLNLFAKFGYEAVSMKDIADKLGITKGALYKHYKNKQDIFNSIVGLATDKGLSRLLSLFLLVLANGDLSMVSNKAIIIDKPKKLSIYHKENISLEKIDFSLVLSIAEFWTYNEVEVEERKWCIKEFQDEHGDLYNALALTNGWISSKGNPCITMFVLCKELQEDGYVLDEDFIKENKKDIMLITPEDINNKNGSDNRFGIIYLGNPDDWDIWA